MPTMLQIMQPTTSTSPSASTHWMRIQPSIPTGSQTTQSKSGQFASIRATAATSEAQTVISLTSTTCISTEKVESTWPLLTVVRGIVLQTVMRPLLIQETAEDLSTILQVDLLSMPTLVNWTPCFEEPWNRAPVDGCDFRTFVLVFYEDSIEFRAGPCG